MFPDGLPEIPALTADEEGYLAALESALQNPADSFDLEPAFRLADRLWILTPGGLLSGTPRALAADGTLARYFAADGIKFDSEQLRFVY